MKKVLYVFMLMCIAGVLVGCSKDNDDTISEDIIITNSVDDIVKDFFDSELPVNLMLTDKTVFVWNGDPWSESYTLINSMEEFQALYRGQKQLPQIDFSTQTLVVGWLTSGAESGTELEIDKKTNELNVYVFRLKDHAYSEMYYSIGYWGVFPKLKTKPDKVNYIHEWR